MMTMAIRQVGVNIYKSDKVCGFCKSWDDVLLYELHYYNIQFKDKKEHVFAGTYALNGLGTIAGQ